MYERQTCERELHLFRTTLERCFLEHKMGNHETTFKFKNCPHLKAEQKVRPQRARLPLHLEEKKQEPAEVLGKVKYNLYNMQFVTYSHSTLFDRF